VVLAKAQGRYYLLVSGGDLEAKVGQLGLSGYYAPLSWPCLLAGYGQFPDEGKMVPAELGLPLASMKNITNLTDHDAQLASLQ
jgi:tryptophan 6-halogenase